jgi:hypothetical protein
VPIHLNAVEGDTWQNSYFSLTTIRTKLALERGTDKWDALTDEKKKELAIQTTSFMDTRFRFYGNKVNAGQGLRGFPTTNRISESESGFSFFERAYIWLVSTVLEAPSLLNSMGVEVGSGSAEKGIKIWETTELKIEYEDPPDTGVPAPVNDSQNVFSFTLKELEVLLAEIAEPLSKSSFDDKTVPFKYSRGF